jgi:hypothetical protein
MKKMKKIKKVGISVLIIFVIFILIILWLGFDHNINGFVLVSGMIRLSFGNDYVTLTNNPLQILVPTANLDLFYSKYFETVESAKGCCCVNIIGNKNGIIYNAQGRVFTRNYWIVAIKEWSV